MGILDELGPAEKKVRPTAVGTDGSGLVLAWDDGRRDVLPMLLVRARCPCAGCVDEWSGKRLLNVTKLAPDVRAVKLGEVGRYALQISWSDGHESGIYSWDFLRRLADEQARGAER